jgi:hypothetical protein
VIGPSSRQADQGHPPRDCMVPASNSKSAGVAAACTVALLMLIRCISDQRKAGTSMNSLSKHSLQCGAAEGSLAGVALPSIPSSSKPFEQQALQHSSTDHYVYSYSHSESILRTSLHSDRLYASIPRDRDLSGGFIDVSCRDMATCVNFMAHWIASHLGVSADFATLAYVGIPDLRSAAVFLGAVKCGYKVR